jgi:hypothetical protein
MAEKIEIDIEAKDKASRIIGSITNSMKKAITSIGDLTKEYSEYGDQVKQLSTFTRMNSSETSRMIQLADDAFVEYNTLTMATKYMAQKGITPSIQGMAELSDKFKAIQDPLQQTQFLIKNFGRSGMEMAKIMELGGEKIKAMGASIGSGLVLDETELQNIQNSKKALDDFNDSIKSMRYDIAGKLLGIFQSMPEPLRQVTVGLGVMTQSGLLDGVASLFITLNGISGLGPKLTGIGTAMKGIAVGTWAAVGPVLAIAAAIVSVGFAIFKVIEFVQRLIEMVQKAASMGKAWDFLSRIFNVYELAKNININDSLNSLGIKGKAKGGSAGGTTLVGEKGPELVNLPAGSFVHSNAESRAMVAGGGNFTLVFSPMFSMADRSELENKIAPMVKNIMRGR